MSYEFSYDEFVDSSDDEVKNQWLIQDSIVFLVDGSRQMYESNSMRKCLEAYTEIVRKKCSFNKKDNFGLIFYATKETNCEVDNVTLLQKFEHVTVDTLKNIEHILNHDIDKYRELALNSDDKYSLYDALEYSFQIANSSKSNLISHKIIILCTCKDDPLVDERRRIEHLVAAFKDNNTKLRVIGMKDSFNDSIFYKDLQIISGTCNNDNYTPMQLNDLEENILYLARSISKLPLKISSDCIVEVALMNLVSFPKYPPKVKLNKTTNQTLEARSFMREASNEDDMEFDDSGESREGGINKIIRSNQLLYYKNYGGEDIHFMPDEHKTLKNAGLQPIIEVLAFKPIVCDPMYHCKSTYFVTCNKNVNEESRNFYRTFVSRCTAKKVMPICKVITRHTVLICNMIPSDDDGGFYLYKIPYNNAVRDFDNLLQAYKYDEENKCPINKDALKLFSKLTKQMEVEFNWKMFSNPKLQKCIAHLEALALDKSLNSLPPDSTRTPPISENAKKLMTSLMNVLEIQEGIDASKKRSSSQEPASGKRSKVDADVVTLARENKLDSLTVVLLKAYLESVGIASKGTKSVLIEKVKEHLGV